MAYAYLFETRGIQRFLFASGRLRDMLGGSELVDFVCAEGGYLDQVLETLDMNPERVRNAGGVFYLVFDNKQAAVRFRAVWRLAAAQWLPGVERVDALEHGDSARQAVAAGLKQLRVNRNIISADLPRPGPLSERSPRTGLAAVCRDRNESLDAATRQQRNFKRPTDTGSLTERFQDDTGIHWPRSFDDDGSLRREHIFPLRKSRMVGIVHADGNGLGELLRTLNNAIADADDQAYINVYSTFSDGLTAATQAAARQAAREVLLPHVDRTTMPARPLVLGGDDLSIIVRDDLALDFASAYLHAFGEHTETAMTKLRTAFSEHGLDGQAHALPTRLSACAGIAWGKCSQPFQGVHDLAEGLCQRAKNASRAHVKQQGYMEPTVAFHKLQDSMAADIETIHARGHSVQHGDQTWHLELNAYALQPHEALPCLQDLQTLVQILSSEAINDRPLRTLATLLHDDIDEARNAYMRWRQVSERRNSKALADFDQQMQALGIDAPADDLPFTDTGKNQHESPLSDLLTLISAAGKEAA